MSGGHTPFKNRIEGSREGAGSRRDKNHRKSSWNVVKKIIPWGSYFRHLPDGQVRDLRYCYASEDIIRVVSGTFEGMLGEVSSAVFQKSCDYPDGRSSGYQVSYN